MVVDMGGSETMQGFGGQGKDMILEAVGNQGIGPWQRLEAMLPAGRAGTPGRREGL